MATTQSDLRARLLGLPVTTPVIDETDPTSLRARLLAPGRSPSTALAQPFPIGTGAAFMAGVGEGLTDFLTIAGMDYEGVKPVTGGEKFVKGVGHLAGLIGAFVPFSYGTGFAMRGLGLAKGANAMNPAVFKFAQTTTAFGLQEFGAGETPKEGVKRGLMGAAFAGGIEGFVLAKRLKSAAKLPMPTSGVGSEAAAAGAEYVVHPDLVTLYRDLNIFGTDDVQKIVDKLVLLGDETAGFQEAAAALGQLYAPNGLTIVSALTDPARFARFIQKENPWTKFYFRNTGGKIGALTEAESKRWVATDGVPGTHEVLMHDTRYVTRLERVAGRDPRLKETLKFLGTGEAIPLTDAYKLLLTDVPGEMLPTPQLFRLGKGSKRAAEQLGKGVRGRTVFEHNSSSGEIELLMEIGGGPFSELSTLAHEYSHAFTSVWDNVTGQRRTSTLREVFGEIAPAEAGARTGESMTVAHGHPLVKALKQAQEEVLIFGYMTEQKMSLSLAKKTAKAFREKKRDYFNRDEELTSWFFELMLLDPKKARGLAPQAVNVLAKRITDDSPKLMRLMSRKGNGFSEAMGLRWAEDRAGKKVWSVLAPLRFTEKQIRNWKAYGLIDGMEVRYGTAQETHVVLKTVAGTGRDKALNRVQLQNARTGAKFTVDRSKVTRPTYPRMALQSKLVGDHLSTLMKKSQGWMGFVRGNADGSFQRGVVDLAKFARAESFVKYMQRHQAEILKGGKISSIKDMRNAVMEHVRTSGKEGLVLEEGGIVTEIFPVSQKSIRMGERLSASTGLTVDNIGVIPSAQGGSDIVRIVPSYRNRVTSILRENGAPEREIDWFIDISKRTEQKQYKGILEDEIIQAHERALEIANNKVREEQLTSVYGIQINPLGHKAAEVGARIDETMTGALRITADDGSVIAKVGTEREAEALLNKIGPDDALPHLDDGKPATTESFGPGLGGPVDKAGSSIPADWEATQFDLGTRRKWLHGWRTGIGKIITPMGSVFRSIEALGKGPAFTKIFEPTQLALKQLDNWIAAKKWDALGKQSIIDAAELVDRAVAKMLPERRRLAVLLDEHMTREQIAAPGGFFERGASSHELGVVDVILNKGSLGGGRFADEVLKYVQLNQLIDQGVGNATKMRTLVLPEIEARIAKGQYDPKFQEVVDMIKTTALEAETREATIASMALSADEKAMLEYVNKLLVQHANPKEEFNILMIARLAGAQGEKEGGIKAFTQAHGFTQKELGMVRDRAQILDAVFEGEGLNRTMLMKGNMPMLRKANELGLHIDNKIFQTEEMEGMRQWIGSRLKSGGINPHDFEPYVSMMRHVQNVGARKYLDPIWKDTMEWAATIKAKDPRLGRVVDEYMEEIRGIGHDSFQRLNLAINQMYGAITGGKQLPADVGERWVNTMLKFGYQASIPFRPALVMRNAFQMQLSLPYLGPEAWRKGFIQSMKDEGFSKAVAGFAIDPNAYPLASSREAFGVANQGKFFAFMSEKYSPELAESLVKAGHGWDDFMRKGLDWYRSPDDLGRSVAYLGTIEKFAPAFAKYEAETVAGHSLAAMEKLKGTMRSSWFGEVVDAEFERLILAGDHNGAASFLGRQLADKTHFLYGHANHPSGWRTVAGRLFGQFGTFPAQYLDYALDAASTQTLKEAIGFWAYNGVMNAGVVAAGSAVGLNLKSWAIMPSLQYTGGPYADMALSMINMVGGSDMEQRMARRNLMLFFPFEVDWDDRAIRFENLESAFVPLSYALGDWEDAFGQNDLFKGLMTGLGFQYIKK